MLSFPNCKINLGLYVTERRPDGYHSLETIFYPVPHVRDALEIVPAQGGEASLTVSGMAVVGDPANNLVWKAWQMLHRHYPQQVPLLDIYLHKAIPMGAGLGGGSADGSFMLRLLNDYAGLELSNGRLEELALQLGSDCPFFIRNTPQFASGRGELMEPVAVDLSGYEIRMVHPGVHVSTGKAFSMITPRPALFDLRQLPELPVAEWRQHIVNDFEAPIFALYPELVQAKEELYQQGAVYASMSGSGSSLFGLFKL